MCYDYIGGNDGFWNNTCIVVDSVCYFSCGRRKFAFLYIDLRYEPVDTEINIKNQ